MMDENNIFYKQNTVPSSITNSDDSYSGASFPWFPSQTKRKSRLGTHTKERVRVLQDVIPNITKIILSKPQEDDHKPKNFSQFLDFPERATPISTYEPILNIASPVKDCKSPRLSPLLAPICPFEPILNISPVKNGFKGPSLSPKSTSISPLEQIPSISPITNDFKPPSISSQPTPISVFEPPFRTSSSINDSIPSISPITDDFKPPSISPQPTPISAFEPPFRTSSSINDFKPLSISPQSTPVSAFESVFSNSSSVNNFKPPNVSRQSNVNLKSSLKKSVSNVNEEKPTVEDVPPEKIRETSPKKEVRFAEPALLPKSTSRKPTKELPAQITVKGRVYRVWRELGSGGSSTVYEVLDPDENDSLAIKRVLLPEDEESVAEGYLQEVQVLEKLQDCDAIIKMFDHELVYENDNQVLYVVMEKGEIDLSKLMRTINKAEKLHYILFCWRQMLSIVSEIHDREIIHMDLKPANFLLVKGKLKLIDFGIASSMPGDKTSIYKDIFSGTLSYMSPEAISFVQSPAGPTGYRISRKSDVWSLGCILYSWIYGQLPFQTSKNKWKRLTDIAAPDKKVEFPNRQDIPETLIDSLKLCLEKDPKKRPTVKELLNLKIEVSLNQVMS